MNFRSHRAGFKESMATRKPISSMEELFERIAHELEKPVKAITISSYGIDARLGHITFIVTTPEGVQGFIDDGPG